MAIDHSQLNHQHPAKLKTVFKPIRSWEPIHTSGDAAISGGADIIFSTLEEVVVITDLKTGKKLHSIDGDSSPITSISCTNVSADLQPSIIFLVAYRSLSLRIYSLQRPLSENDVGKLDLTKTISRSHEAPISISRCDPTASIFATGDTSGVVKIWDARAGHCTHVFKGHGGIVSALCFDIDVEQVRMRLAVGSGDCRIKLWDLSTHLLVGSFEGGHVSIVRGLEISPNGQKMVSGSRDKVLNIWDLSKSSSAGQILKTIPVYETIEALGLINHAADLQTELKGKSKARTLTENSEGDLLVYTAGDKGIIRIWNATTGSLVKTEHDNHPEGINVPRACITDARLDPVSNVLLVNKVDQTFSVFKMPGLQLMQQIVGSHDEIIDISLLNLISATDSPSHLAIATNSPLVRVLSLGEGENNCSLLRGHSDIVLCLAKNKGGNMFVSGSKDRTARIWSCSELNKDDDEKLPTSSLWKCVAVCEGHMQSLGALSWAEFNDNNGRPISLLATASQDRTVKIWELSSLIQDTKSSNHEFHKLNSLLTLKIHDKDINSIDFSPDCKMFASGSQDKLGKIFSLEHSKTYGTSLNLLGILKGHSRGIWSIKFSKFNSYVVTGSGDNTIKLWSADLRQINNDQAKSDFTASSGFCSCLKTFEGHTNAILRLDFFNSDQQIVSTSSDSLVKIWDIKTQVCIETLGDDSDESDFLTNKQPEKKNFIHDGKVWALDILDEAGSAFITAGADSKLIYWEDQTELVADLKLKNKALQVQLNQDVDNYIRLKDYGLVIKLLIKLDKPARLLKLFNEISTREDAEEEADLTSITGSDRVDHVIKTLRSNQLFRLLTYVRDWNSMSKTAEVAQRVLNAILRFHSFSEILNSFDDSSSTLSDEISMINPGEDNELLRNTTVPKVKKPTKADLKSLLDTLLPYTERHLIRVEKFNQDSTILQYFLNQINGGLSEF